MKNAVMTAAAETITRLENQVRLLQAELERTQKATLASMLGPLRLHGIVLAHVGTNDPAELVEDLSKDFTPWEVNQTIRHLFLLNHAPCSDELREQIRAVFRNGICKF